MTGFARAAADPSFGFDCLAPVTRAILQAAKADPAHPCSWVMRYLDGDSPLTPAERDLIWSERMGIVLVSEAYEGGPISPGTLGPYGALCARLAAALEAPPTVDIIADLELAKGRPSDATSQAYADWIAAIMAGENAFVSAVRAAGYDSPHYQGMPYPLTADEAYHGLTATRYVRGAGVPLVECGYAMEQTAINERRWGTLVDLDVAHADKRGRTITMWWGDGPA